MELGGTQLRYVGGETRLLSVPRDIRLPDLLERLAETYGPNLRLKYQVGWEVGREGGI